MRISRERMYMDIAQSFAKRSTCFRNNVGAVIVFTDGWVINGTGYNGPLAGEEHCRGNDCDFTPSGGCLRSVHAEINALNRFDNHHSGEHWLFTTRSPCYPCAEAIRDSGVISRVYYEEAYRDLTPLEILEVADISIFRVTPAGFVIKPNGGRIQVEYT